MHIYHLLYRSVNLQQSLLVKNQFFSIDPGRELDLNMMTESHFLASKI